MKGQETAFLQYTFVNGDEDWISYIKDYGLYATTNSSAIQIQSIYSLKERLSEIVGPFVIQYTSQYAEADFIVQDDWESIEITLVDNTELDNIQFKIITDAFKNDGEDYNTGVKYINPEANKTKIVFADQIAKGEPLADEGATAATSLGIINVFEGHVILYVTSAKVTKKDGSTIYVIPSMSWGGSVTQD